MSSHRSRSGQPGPDAPGDPVPAHRRTGVLAATAVLVLGLDLVSKVLVVAKLMHRPPVKLPGDFLWLVHARNPGAAFSFAEGATVVFTAVAAIVIAVIVRTASKLRSTAWAISLGLVLGGAAGNLVDRLFRSPAPLRGWVVDWISLRSPDGRMLFPIFNLADSGIVCGGILAVLLALLGVEMDGSRGGKKEPVPPPAAPPAAGPPDGQRYVPSSQPLPGPGESGSRPPAPGGGAWRPAPDGQPGAWRPAPDGPASGGPGSGGPAGPASTGAGSDGWAEGRGGRRPAPDAPGGSWRPAPEGCAGGG